MKYRLVQETRNTGDIVFYTEYESELSPGIWLYCSRSLTTNLTKAQIIFNNIRTSQESFPIIKVIEEAQS